MRRRFDGLPAALARHGDFRGVLATAFAHFRKATRSYRPHLFACYDVEGLPRPIEPGDLAPSDLAAWRELRASLERRRAVRALGRRFRRDPDAYLRSLEDDFINRALPP